MNFGSGWFPTLAKRPGCSGYFNVAWSIADRFRADGPWPAAELRTLRADELAAVLGQRRDHELMALYAQALRALGAFLGGRDALAVVREARRLGRALRDAARSGMAMFADRGFYKRAQIAAADLALAGVAQFGDLHRLTIFADNLVPHVLRCDGVLRYDEALAEHIDAGRLLRPARRSARSARARCMPASSSPHAPAWRRTSSTTGCGAAGRRPPYKARRATAAARSGTEPLRRRQPPAGFGPRTWRSARTSASGRRSCPTAPRCRARRRRSAPTGP